MDYILIILLAIGFFVIYKKVNVSDSQNNQDEVKELRDSLNKVLGKMESDNKNLRQAFIDEKVNMEKLVLEVVKENTESQTENFEKESQNLIKSINEQSKEFNDYFARIDSTIGALDNVTREMKGEINDFSKILGASSSLAGDLGEFQLENLFKFHNLQKNIDYMTQVNVPIADGRSYQPDAILISEDKCLIIDSKATANLEVIKELKNEETSKERMEEIKSDIKDKVSNEAKKLSKKEYQNLTINGKSTPEFIVMFIPNENIYLIVKELIDKETNKIEDGVIMAGPDNLNFIILMWAYINGILKVQSQIEQIGKAASAVHNNFANSTKNLNKLKSSIESTITNWNTLVGNVEGRLIPSVKKLEEMGVKSSQEILDVEKIIQTPRPLEKLVENKSKLEQGNIDFKNDEK
ncbi:DNA recombination protein RmuC [bacterium]|jgi:DNA recombination protein RmuC|nr:DNA recombination protein RmuC [bacterium]MBT3795337.1 DNA recombination protein RmuC [bacterium]MBT4633834.1 DNA recombination protein RmuC [bacterium]